MDRVEGESERGNGRVSWRQCDNQGMSPLRAIVFDFDGLIVETEQPIYDTYRAIFAEYGVELALDVWAGVVGGSGHRDMLFDYFEGRLGRKVDRDAVRKRARRQQHDVVTRSQPGRASQRISSRRRRRGCSWRWRRARAASG